MGKVEALKRFFSTPEKPVTNAELLALMRADPKGFEELAELAQGFEELAELDLKVLTP